MLRDVRTGLKNDDAHIWMGPISSRTPISPPLVKGTDLLRPVVESRSRATASDNRRMTAFPFRAVFVSSAGSHPDAGAMRGRAPTPIEAQASRGEV